MAFDLFSCFFFLLVSLSQNTNYVQRFLAEMGWKQSERERKKERHICSDKELDKVV